MRIVCFGKLPVPSLVVAGKCFEKKNFTKNSIFCATMQGTERVGLLSEPLSRKHVS